MLLKESAEYICDYLKTLPQVQRCALSGSLCRGNFDKYSDIDIEIDVSGTDNGQFVMEIPDLLSNKFQVIYYDYAAGLAPDKYVVSIAIDEDNPFMLADICCCAAPHCTSVSKQDLNRINNKFDHILKLFTINLKHYIRGADCCKDIQKMYKKLFDDSVCLANEEMLGRVYRWIKENAEERHERYIKSYKRYCSIASCSKRAMFFEDSF